jgi:hypothetical protein
VQRYESHSKKPHILGLFHVKVLSFFLSPLGKKFCLPTVFSVSNSETYVPDFGTYVASFETYVSNSETKNPLRRKNK